MRCLTEFYPVTPLSLVDLSGQGGLARIGADSRLFAGSRAIARRWSRAIYEHPNRLKVHGILYPAGTITRVRLLPSSTVRVSRGWR